MNFETVLFAAAFLILAAISIPENQQVEQDTTTVSALLIETPNAPQAEEGEDELTKTAQQPSSK